MLVGVITDGLVWTGKWECRYELSSDFGTIEIRGGGPESILDFVVGTGFKGDLWNETHLNNITHYLFWITCDCTKKL